jgi:hypothetical protein
MTNETVTFDRVMAGRGRRWKVVRLVLAMMVSEPKALWTRRDIERVAEACGVRTFAGVEPGGSRKQPTYSGRGFYYAYPCALWFTAPAGDCLDALWTRAKVPDGVTRPADAGGYIRKNSYLYRPTALGRRIGRAAADELRALMEVEAPDWRPAETLVEDYYSG